MKFCFTGEPLTEAPVKPTPFSERACAANIHGTLSVWGPHALPEVFVGAQDEVNALRNTAMIEDKSPLISTHISGKHAEIFVDSLITRDASKIEINHANYTPWCDENGKVIVEGLIFRLSEDDFILTSNDMMQWFEQNRGSLDVAFYDITGTYGILALQGPVSRDILEKATNEPWGDLRFSRGRQSKVAGADVFVWRTGFTGGKGYELWVPPSAGNDVWDTLMEIGTPLGLLPCGHHGQDIARVEAGLVLPGIDYTRAGADESNKFYHFELTNPALVASPYELDLGRFVDLNKESFMGREALERESQSTENRKKMMAVVIDWKTLVKNCVDGNQLPIFGTKVRRTPPLQLLLNNEPLGYATSVTWSNMVKGLIGLAQIPLATANEGTVVTVQWPFGDNVFETTAELVKTPIMTIQH